MNINFRRRREIKCSYLETQDIKIELINSKGIAYLGIEDITSIANIVKGSKIHIDYVIRHKQSYRGGGSYGEFGGFDITLIHLEKPAESKFKPACLPTQLYQDTSIGPAYEGPMVASLAGFGNYFREPCITDEYGPSKYHYCNEPSCNFNDPPQREECKLFFASSNTPDTVPTGKEELLVVDQHNDIHYCYRLESPNLGSDGWCTVSVDATEIGEKKSHLSWGFCGKDCYLAQTKEKANNVLRKVDNVDILDESLCNRFLEASLENTRHIPKILCIGYFKSLSYEVWKRTGTGYTNITGSPEYEHRFKKDTGRYIQ